MPGCIIIIIVIHCGCSLLVVCDACLVLGASFAKGCLGASMNTCLLTHTCQAVRSVWHAVRPAVVCCCSLPSPPGHNRCDRHHDLTDTMPLFPGVDFSLVSDTNKDTWWDEVHDVPCKSGQYPTGESQQETEQRGVEFYEWLMTRSVCASVVVVGEGMWHVDEFEAAFSSPACMCHAVYTVLVHISLLVGNCACTPFATCLLRTGSCLAQHTCHICLNIRLSHLFHTCSHQSSLYCWSAPLVLRPESCIAVVSHCGFLRHSLDGLGAAYGREVQERMATDFQNCEMRAVVLTSKEDGSFSAAPGPEEVWFPGGWDWRWQKATGVSESDVIGRQPHRNP